MNTLNVDLYTHHSVT